MKRYLWHLLVGLPLLVLAVLLPVSSSHAQWCEGEVFDVSTATPEGICGNNYWALTADDYGIYAETFQCSMAYGACDGGYFACDNTYVQQSYIYGNEYFYDDGPGSGGEYVSWTLDDWSVTYSSCNNGNSNDEVEHDQNNWYPTPEYLMACY